MSTETPKQPTTMRLLEPVKYIKGNCADDVHREAAIMLTTNERKKEASSHTDCSRTFLAFFLNVNRLLFAVLSASSYQVTKREPLAALVCFVIKEVFIRSFMQAVAGRCWRCFRLRKL